LSWTVVVPIKGFAQAKSRFGDEMHRGTLASAFVTDVVAALLAAPRVAKVIVVTSDVDAVNIAHLLGAQSTADPGTGLNAAIAAGATNAMPVAAILGDVPCVSPDDIEWALAQAEQHDRSYITDAAGTGTTFLATTASALDPAFGEHSAAAHEASGAHRIDGASAALHRDVDTEVDLWDAVRIGVGKATRRALANQ